MAYLKRQKVPKTWPIHRKGTAYVVAPRFSVEKGIPVLIILRDILKLASNRREVKKIIHGNQVLLNNKVLKDDKHNVLLFDVLNVVPSNKFYRMLLSKKGKFEVREVSANEAGRKVAKVIGKRILKGKKAQINLSDGRNFLSDMKCSLNDSALVNFLEGKLEKCLPLKEKSNVLVFEGKHAGQSGEIQEIKGKIASVKIGNQNIDILIKQLIVTE